MILKKIAFFDAMYITYESGGDTLSQSTFDFMTQALQQSINNCFFRNISDSLTTDLENGNSSSIPVIPDFTFADNFTTCASVCTFTDASCVNNTCQYTPNLNTLASSSIVPQSSSITNYTVSFIIIFAAVIFLSLKDLVDII